MQIGHICSNNVVTCSSNTTVLEAAQLMRRNHVGTLIVIEEINGMMVPQGIVTDRDIVVVVLAEGLDPKSIKVIDIMKVELMTAVETEDVFETVERMRFKGVRRIPIVDKMGGLVGIVSVDDIWKFLSKEISELADVTTRQQTREKVARGVDGWFCHDGRLHMCSLLFCRYDRTEWWFCRKISSFSGGSGGLHR